jgi:hypothetical protein
MTTQLSTQTLYEQDFYLWLETTAKYLRERDLEHLDWDNLLEEIESMGRSEKKEVRNRLVGLLMHLLKWKYQSSYRSKSWLSTINEQRRRINFTLEDSPSLNAYYESVFPRCYTMAHKEASRETDLSVETFPEQCPFTPQDTLNPDYLPD